MTVLLSSSQSELVRRMTWFIVNLTPEERKLSIICGEPKLCDEGKKLFGPYCDDQHNSAFITHIAVQSDGCQKCRDGFIKHLWLVTD